MTMGVEESGWALLKRTPRRDVDPVSREREAIEESGEPRIRCPRCEWEPLSSSRWSCERIGTPEPPFPACGTVWNTFETRGRCPGCGHQWFWTTCHQCHEASPHEEWYAESQGD
jgi:hypothetical protein